MNKNRHRVVFNAARGQRMAVSETASAFGGPSSPPMPALAFVALLLMPLGLAHAQVVADPSAPGNQRPTILQTANGLPQVNIQTPSAAGVSRNTYSRFDVPPSGVILNNSRTDTNTQLAGNVAGNPWIGTPARVILNEVNASNPSYLNGPVEVAGQRAEVIVANPSGIRVNGGTFLNASGVTLTTGRPVMNSGNLESFRVTKGSVVVEGLGLDTRTADYTAILARAMEVNAGLWAKHLTVVTGTNDVKALATGAAAHATPIAGSGPAPSFMLDVAAIGGMYAGHIYLVGTEAGLGVNNRGSLAAQEGEWVLRADGWLVNTGKVQAKTDLSIEASGAVDNRQGTLSADQRVTVSSKALNNDKGLIRAGTALTIDTHGQALTNTNATGHSSGAGGIVAGTATSLTTGALDNRQGDILSGGTLGLTTQAITNQQGRVQAVGAVTFDTQGAVLDNTAGRIASQSTLALDTGDLINGAHATQAGLIGSNGHLHLQAAAVTNGASGATRSNIWSAQMANVTTTSFTNAGVLSGGNVTLEATTNVTNAAGASIEANGNLTITAPTATLTNAGKLIANQTLDAKAMDISNTGRMEAANHTLVRSATGIW